MFAFDSLFSGGKSAVSAGNDLENVGIGSFTLDVRVREDVARTMIAPTTPLEDGSVASDHVIENPLELSLEGEVSEVRYNPTARSEDYKRVKAEVGNITKYIPPLTRAQINKSFELVNDSQAVKRKIEAVISDGTQAIEFFGNKSPSKSPQDNFIDAMQAYQKSRMPIRIQAQRRVYENMILESVVTTSDNQSGQVLRYKITAKQINFTEIAFSLVDSVKSSPSSGLNGQTDGAKAKWLNKPEALSESLAKSIFESVKGAFD
jgi:hypothetical protein